MCNPLAAHSAVSTVKAAQHSTAQHSTAQHSTAQHSTAQQSNAQHSAAQRSTAQHSTAQHSSAMQHSMGLQLQKSTKAVSSHMTGTTSNYNYDYAEAKQLLSCGFLQPEKRDQKPCCLPRRAQKPKHCIRIWRMHNAWYAYNYSRSDSDV